MGCSFIKSRALTSESLVNSETTAGTSVFCHNHLFVTSFSVYAFNKYNSSKTLDGVKNNQTYFTLSIILLVFLSDGNGALKFTSLPLASMIM